METRAKRDRLEKIRIQLKFIGMFVVEPRGLSSGMALLWKSDVDIDGLAFSPNCIHTTVSSREDPSVWECSFIYGDPNSQFRDRLWQTVANLVHRNSTPWCCIGDFNDILFPHEKEGVRAAVQSRIHRFRHFLHGSNLMDLELKGCKFTWYSNPRGGVVIRERIDRVLANWNWSALFPNAQAIALTPISSDHSPIVINPILMEKSGVQFKYKLLWDEHEECRDVEKKGWS